jgi:cell division protein FtsQ
VAGVVAVVVTAGALAWGATQSSLLDVDEIRVEGVSSVAADDLVAASGIVQGQPLIEVDVADAAARVRAVPVVAEVRVDRYWSGRIVIRASERVPVAQIPVGDGSVLVDVGGRVLAASAVPAPDLPRIDGVEAPLVGQQVDDATRDAVAVAVTLSPGTRSRVTSVRPAPDGVELGLRPCGTVRLGSADDHGLALSKLTTILAQVDLTNLATIDLRIPDAPVLTRSTSCT